MNRYEKLIRKSLSIYLKKKIGTVLPCENAQNLKENARNINLKKLNLVTYLLVNFIA